MTAMKAMAQAFTAAGYVKPKTPRERLEEMMREAILHGDGLGDRSLDHFVASLVKAEDRADLLWELMGEWRSQIINRLFTTMLIKMRAETALPNAGKAKRCAPTGHELTAEPAPHTAVGAESALPKGQHAAASAAVPDAAGAQSRLPKGQEKRVPAAPQPSRKVLSASAKIARLSILRTFRKIGNKPLAEVTGAQARVWLKDHQRDGRFVSLVSYNVPDEMTIGAMVPDDEADRLYKLAMEA